MHYHGGRKAQFDVALSALYRYESARTTRSFLVPPSPLLSPILMPNRPNVDKVANSPVDELLPSPENFVPPGLRELSVP